MASTTLVSTICQLVRDQIGDKDVVRWPDAKMFRYVTTLRSRLLGDHPEAGYVERVTRAALDPVAAGTEEIGILAEYDMDLVHMVAEACEAEDSEDAGNFEVTNYHRDKAPGDILQ